jgi:hypothetical protein
LKPIGIFLIDDGEMILNAMKGVYYKTKESVDEYIKLAKDVNG